jgi:hypothetical protein
MESGSRALSNGLVVVTFEGVGDSGMCKEEERMI